MTTGRIERVTYNPRNFVACAACKGVVPRDYRAGSCPWCDKTPFAVHEPPLVIGEALLSPDEVDLLRQWFNALSDVTPEYLEEKDRALYRKIIAAAGVGGRFLRTQKALSAAAIREIHDAWGVLVKHNVAL